MQRMEALSADGKLSILAVDHRSSLRQIFEQQNAEATEDAIRDFKDDVCRILGPAVSAILIDSATAERCVIEGALPAGTAVVCPLESEKLTVRDGVRYTEFDPYFGPADAHRVGAIALKLLFHYRADICESVDYHLELVNEASARCAAEELPLIIEPIPYRLDGEDSRAYEPRYPELVAAMVKQLAATNADVFKVPFPGGAEGASYCAQIDEAVGARPWVVLGGSKPADEFARDLAVALAAGASGFIVGRSVWASAVGMAPEQRRAFLRKRASEVLAGLQAQTAAAGTPWQARYSRAAGSVSDS